MNGMPDDATFLCSSDHRCNILTALSDDACDRRDLQSITGASQPTVSRILADFERRHWIRRDGHRYRLTELGTLITERLAAFAGTMRTAEQLREIWPWLPHEIDEFSIELFTDIVISRPGPAYPYQPMPRLTTLLSETSSLRGFGMALLKSGHLELFVDRLQTGFECEYVYPPEVFAELLSWNHEVIAASLASGNYVVYVHDDLPIDERCGVCVFDDRTSICCNDTATGTLQSLVDTGSVEMHEWAESYYQRYRAEACFIDPEDDLRSMAQSLPSF